MPGWGLDEWGLDGYGSIALVSGAVNTAPVVQVIAPIIGSVNNDEDAVICINILDVDLVPGSTSIYVDDVLAYNGTGGFSAGFIGTAKSEVGVQTIKLTKVNGWGFDTEVKVRAVAQDFTALTTDLTWTWRTRADPVCYTGLTPLDVERQLTQPFTTYTAFEPVRQLMMGAALKADQSSSPNALNKAARVVYQAAYRTEISTVQNAYIVRNASALATTVCEQARYVDIDKFVVGNKSLLSSTARATQSSGLFAENYVTEFIDYLDSTLYHYRVSMAANLALLGAGAELQAA